MLANFLLAATLLSSTSTTPTVSMRRTLRPGETFKYKVTCEYCTRGEGDTAVPNNLSGTWQCSYTVDSVDGDKAQITGRIENLVFDNTRADKANAVPDSTIPLVMDSTGQMLPKDGKDTRPVYGWLLWDYLQLPAKDVSVGDTWSLKMPEFATLNAGGTVPAKLTKTGQFEGKDAWFVDVDVQNVTYHRKMNLFSKDSKTPVQEEIEGVGSMKIRSVLDASTGRALMMVEQLHSKEKLTGAKGASYAEFTAIMRDAS